MLSSPGVGVLYAFEGSICQHRRLHQSITRREYSESLAFRELTSLSFVKESVILVRNNNFGNSPTTRRKDPSRGAESWLIKKEQSRSPKASFLWFLVLDLDFDDASNGLPTLLCSLLVLTFHDTIR